MTPESPPHANQPAPDPAGPTGAGGQIPAPRSETPAQPLPKRGCTGSLTALVSVLVGALYVANPGAGGVEFLPDFIPLFGNLDEAAATTMLVLGIQYLFGKGRQD